MAAITANFSLNFNMNTEKFEFTDTTDYVGQGETAANWDGVLKITSPSGLVIYNNTSFASPDIDLATTTTNSLISLPTDSVTGIPLNGNYEVTYSISDGVDTCPVTKSFSFQYVSPTITLVPTFDCVTPLLKDVDATNYLVDGQTPTSITRVHTLYYPDTTAGPDISGDAVTIQSSVMYVRDDGGALQYEVKCVSTVSYSYPASGSSSLYTVSDVLTGVNYMDVVCDPDLCSVYCGIKKQYDHYMDTKGTLEGDKAKAKLVLMTGIAELARIAFECNKTADVTALLDEIKRIGGFADDCACGTGDIVLYQGLGVVAPGVVVDDGPGIDVSSVTVGDTTTYTVEIKPATLSIINTFEKSLPVNGNQVTVTDLGIVGDARNFQIDLNLALTAGNIPMVTSLGTLLEDSPLSYDGTDLAVGLASGKTMTWAFGAGQIDVSNTQSVLTVGAFSSGVANDGATYAGSVASATSSIKVKTAGITELFGNQQHRLNASEGNFLESINTLDTISIQLLAGIATHKAAKFSFEMIAPSDSYGAGYEYIVKSAAGTIISANAAGKLELGLGATNGNLESVALGNISNSGGVAGNIAIGYNASIDPFVLVGNPQIAIGHSAATGVGGQIAIGYKAGEDAGTQNINAISIGTYSNFSAVSNGLGVNSIALGVSTQNFEAADKGISIGSNIENNQIGTIIMGYSSGAPALTAPQAQSFNLGFNTTTPQVTFGVTSSFYNLSNILFGGTGAAASVVTVTGDVEVTDVGNGFILKSPDSTRWRIEVADTTGAVSSSAV